MFPIKKELVTVKTLLYKLAKADQIELVRLFCRKLKENHPDFALAVLNHQVRSGQIERSTQEPRLKTAVIIAAEKRNGVVVRILVDAGADYMTPVDDLTPQSYAPLWSSSQTTLKLLCLGEIKRPLTSIEKLRSLDYCCAQGNFAAATRLIEQKIVHFPIDQTRDAEGNGLLLVVLKATLLTQVQKRRLVELLTTGPNKDDARQTDRFRKTPLMLAQEDPETLQLIQQSLAA